MRESVGLPHQSVFRLTTTVFMAWALLSLESLGALGQSLPSQDRVFPPPQAQQSSIGREVSVPVHLQDGQEFSLPLDTLLAHGQRLFNATWTDQEGAAAP